MPLATGPWWAGSDSNQEVPRRYRNVTYVVLAVRTLLRQESFLE